MKPGAYKVDARVIVQRRAVEMTLEELGQLSVGLFTEPPSPEGAHGQELVIGGYSRQSVSFSPLSPHRRLSLNETKVVFEGIEGWPQPTLVVLFDTDGGVLGYGLLVTEAGAPGGVLAAFAVTAIALRFS